jgi:hypothetical protein
MKGVKFLTSPISHYFLSQQPNKGTHQRILSLFYQFQQHFFFLFHLEKEKEKKNQSNSFINTCIKHHLKNDKKKMSCIPEEAD